MIPQKLKAWLFLSRIPFHTVGLLPFILGFIIAERGGYPIHWVRLIWGSLGVVLIMLSTYYGGEYWDFREDSLSEPSLFSGGSKVLQRGLLKRRSALIASISCALLAVSVGAVLQFGYKTGAWTLPLGLIGLIGGFFYSSKPIRWVSRGLGEVWIAFCYGWLPVAVGYYLQRGSIDPLIHWMAAPIGLTIFNVILLNEFLDYVPDKTTGKANLVVRLGRPAAACLYAAASALSWVTMILSVWAGVPIRALLLYIPVFAASALLVILILRGAWRKRENLQRLCALTMVVNLLTTGVLIGSYCL
jgi:1,4-dihydroxy-2-naphthoate octaprenyltransferase